MFYYNSSLGSCEGCSQACVMCMNSSYCESCVSNASAVGTGCECLVGFYYDSTYCACEPCPRTCKSCQSNQICDECIAINSHPDTTSTQARCICTDGYFMSNNSCISCDATCKKCSSSVCQQCSDPNSVPDYTSNNGRCKCIDGYFMSNSICLPCDSSCLTCNSSSCITCVSPKATVTGSVCECSPTGFYSDSPGVCLSCDFSCKTCIKAQCLTCFNSDASINGKFCRCPSNMFTLDSHRTCQQCPNNCSACSSLISCSLCLDSKAVAVNGVCQCSLGYFEVQNSCVSCNKTCASCDIGSRCLECVDPNAVVNDLKSACECKSGFYFDSVCLPCHFTCNICSKTGCSLCAFNNSYVKGSECVCVDGFYLANKGCLECDSICLTCSESICLTCVVNSVLNNGMCECNPNSEYIGGKCECLEGFTGNNSCVKCERYVTSENFSAILNPQNFSIEINFLVFMEIKLNVKCEQAIQNGSLAYLGTGPICYWKDAATFIIMLGASPNLTSLQISLIPSFFISNESECQLIPQTSLIASLLLFPNNSIYEYTRSSIIGPDTVSKSCSRSITYSHIAFEGSKNFKELVWTSDPLAPVSSSYSKATFDISSVTSDSITITVTQVVYLGNNISSTFTTSLVNKPNLQLTIRNGNSIISKSSQTLIVIADITDDCNSTGNTSWSWSLISPLESNISLKIFSNFIVISPFTLSCGISYNFSVNATKGVVFGESFFYVNPLCEDLVIVLSRVSGSVSTLLPTFIDASNSYDPDGGQVQFGWTFSNYLGPVDSKSASIVLLPQYLTVNSLITVFLTIATSEKSASYSIELIPVSLNLDVNSTYTSQRVNLPEEFEANFNSGTECRFLWNDSNSVTVSKNSILDVSSLMLPRTYQFSLTCNSSVFSVYLPIFPNLPPQCLEFSVSSNNITAYTELLNVSAFHCFDGDELDYPLMFNYGLNDSDTYFELISDSYTADHEFYLFPGTFKVVLKVCDALKLCTEYISDNVVVNFVANPNAEVLYSKLNSSVYEAIVVVGYKNQLTPELVQIMWADVKSQSVINEVNLRGFLSAMKILAAQSNFDFDFFISTLGNSSAVVDNSVLDLLCDVSDQLVETGSEIDKIFELNTFIMSGLKTALSLQLQQSTQKQLKNSAYFKSTYVNSSISPSFITNIPAASNSEILNLQLITYNTPPAISLLFTASGTYSKGKYNLLNAESEIHYSGVEIYVTLQISNDTQIECIYKNSSGNYSDGCSVFSANDTSTVLLLTHTSFFYLSTNSTTNTSSSSQSTSYTPCYILNSLIVACPSILLILKFFKKRKHENEDLEFKEDDLEEHKENSPLPTNTLAEDTNIPKPISMFYFHLYLGAYIDGGFYLSSLKFFTILCSNVSNLFFIGVLLTSLEPTSNSSSTLQPLQYLQYASLTFLITLPIQSLFHYLFSRPRSQNGKLLALGFACGVTFITAVSIQIIVYNYYMSANWAQIWSLTYCFTLILELVFHTVIMLFLYSMKDSFASQALSL